ncbi:hypothetical protein PYW08_005805 [Mythimna loreyi]|uniref:Uncharacterized protein n=1 Tax=Mythimna loreyi TaxID=667449 RepID=A0ACC2QI42_9NEOP|nr:hypothetical protein PYW08_005805 [Mythimna loreyi]
MARYSDNYYLRQCYLRQEQVPTISVIKKTMTPPLADVYFKSMKPRIKELAGLEPPLKGGGGDWYQPPEDLLNSRAVLKPIKKNVLSKLNHQGVISVGTTLFSNHRKAMDAEIEQALQDSDEKWRKDITKTTSELFDDLAAAATKSNTKHLIEGFDRFSLLYQRTMAKIEILFHESAITEIKNTRENAILEMKYKYSTILKHQATLLYDAYEKKLQEKKNQLKDEFMKKVEAIHTSMADKIHDLNFDKHRAVESLRHYLQCQNLACGVYVALKERETCSYEIEKLERKQKKKVGILQDTIQMKDYEIHLAGKKELKRLEFCDIWRKKVCLVVKSFQRFVLYCLQMLPDHAEFFINMEKLMLLQLNETLEDPEASSIIEEERELFHTPVPQIKPFYLFCDRSYKAPVQEDLCPKRSGISTPSDLPAIIVNKRCLYAACDNFEQFRNKIREFLHGNRGDDADFEDDNVYEHFVPVKYGSSQKLKELKLESSLLQILQQELGNMEIDEDKAPVMCDSCGLPWCVPCPVTCQPAVAVAVLGNEKIDEASHDKIHLVGRNVKLDHEREPKWNSYLRHIEPKMCSCAKTAKKHLSVNLPVYMRRMSYGAPEIPGYEICSIEELKKLVKATRRPVISPVQFPAKTKDMGTQCVDEEYDTLCTCFADRDLSRFSIDLKTLSLAHTDTYRDSVSSSYLTKMTDSFAMSRAQSLRNLIELTEIKEILSRKHCVFE